VDFAQWIEPKYLNVALGALSLTTYWPSRNGEGDPLKPGN
jgi:hypothetical protein